MYAPLRQNLTTLTVIQVGASTWPMRKKQTKTYVPGPGLPEEVIKHAKPLLVELTDDDLLEKCAYGKTQNQNESLNAMVWNKVPKGSYVGLRQLEIGVYDAVSHFNIGNKAAILVYEKLGMVTGYGSWVW